MMCPVQTKSNLKSFTVTTSILLCILILLIPCTSTAGSTSIRPFLGAHITYDDNIVFSKKSASDWIYEILPAIDIKYQDERNIVDFVTKGQGQHYDTEDQLDTFDVDLNLFAKRQQTERLGLSITGHFAKDTTLDQTLNDTGLLMWRQDRLVYAVNPEVEWKLNERSTISASLPWYKVDYDWGKYQAGNIDFYTLYLYLTYTYQWDEKTSLFIRPDIGKMNFDTGDYRTADLMFGISRDFTERLFGKIYTGVNYTDSKTDIYVYDWVYIPGLGYAPYNGHKKTKNDHYWGWVAEAGLKWQLDRGQLSADFTRRVDSSGYGEPVMRTYFVSAASWKITERLTGRLRGGISHIKSHNLTYDQNYYTYSVFPSLMYRVTRYIDAGIQYSYQYIDDNEHDSNNRDRNRIMFRVEIKDFNLHLNF